MSYDIQFIDNRPATKTRRKRKSTLGNNTNPPTTKDSTMNSCTTPTKKRSPANNIYPQPPSQGINNNMPGVRKFFVFLNQSL